MGRLHVTEHAFAGRAQVSTRPTSIPEKLSSCDPIAIVPLSDIEDVGMTLGSGSEGEVLLARYRGTAKFALSRGLDC